MELTQQINKSKTLFDHLNQIRYDKDINYYDNLNDQEKKDYNQYMILMGLSMDKSCIEDISYISKYINIIPNSAFYKMCCELIPKRKVYCKWIKSSKGNINIEILRRISQYYDVSIRTSWEYYEVLLSIGGIESIRIFLRKYGLTDKEIKEFTK